MTLVYAQKLTMIERLLELQKQAEDFEEQQQQSQASSVATGKDFETAEITFYHFIILLILLAFWVNFCLIWGCLIYPARQYLQKTPKDYVPLP